MGNQIVPSNGSSVSNYGSRDQVKEMAERLRKMMPGTVKLNDEEALTVAQIAIAHGLDPFNGEVWGLKSSDGKWYGTMVGIKGLRRAAKRQADREGGTYWLETPIRVEGKKYNEPDTSIVYEINLRDTVTMQAYGKSLYALTQAGIPYAEAIRMMGNAPIYTGVGIVRANEQSKMKFHALAVKRAEADAIKKRYDVSFPGVEYTDTSEDAPADALLPEAVTEGEYTHPEPDPVSAPVVVKRDKAQVMMELGLKDTLTIDEARSMKNKDGAELGTLDDEQLKVLLNKFPSGAPLHKAAQLLLDFYQQPAEATEDQ